MTASQLNRRITDRDPVQSETLRLVLDPREANLVVRALAEFNKLPKPEAAKGRRILRDAVSRLISLWEAIDKYPRTRDSHTLGQRFRNVETLLDTLADNEPYAVDSYLPTRAALARAYGVAKFNFTRMLHYTLNDMLGDLAEHRSLSADADQIQRSAVAEIISEEVLRTIASDAALEPAKRHRAATWLTELWDQRATRSLADFSPLLDAAWRAKADVTVCYGTMTGVSELFQLMSHGCPEQFLDTFGCNGHDLERYAAFEEFVFNVSYEHLQKLREYMKEHGQQPLDVSCVAQILGVNRERLHTTTATASDMFHTFRERESWARQRRLLDRPGPKQTAEAYVMLYVLGQSGN